MQSSKDVVATAGTVITVPCFSPGGRCNSTIIEIDEKPCVYTVRSGDTLDKIAQAYCMQAAALLKMNPSSKLVVPGAKLFVPCGTEVTCHANHTIGGDCEFETGRGGACGGDTKTCCTEGELSWPP